MLTTIIKQLFSGVVRLHHLPAALMVQWRCARRIDAMTHRLLRMRAKIRALSGHVLSGALKDALDPDGTLATMLADLKEETRTLRYQLAQWHVKECKGRAGVRLKASMLVLNRIAAETYAAADRLAWEIVEHDKQVPAQAGSMAPNRESVT
ncbi:MAG TPA: hypothetical protein VF663_10735 [Telluria sp.]